MALVPLLILYKAHLYGIEIIEREDYSYKKDVLIAPLWNWNSYKDSAPAKVDGSNRTFMELKWCESFRIGKQ